MEESADSGDSEGWKVVTRAPSGKLARPTLSRKSGRKDEDEMTDVLSSIGSESLKMTAPFDDELILNENEMDFEEICSSALKTRPPFAIQRKQNVNKIKMASSMLRGSGIVGINSAEYGFITYGPDPFRHDEVNALIPSPRVVITQLESGDDDIAKKGEDSATKVKKDLLSDQMKQKHETTESAKIKELKDDMTCQLEVIHEDLMLCSKRRPFIRHKDYMAAANLRLGGMLGTKSCDVGFFVYGSFGDGDLSF